jgi:hypothetical protein
MREFITYDNGEEILVTTAETEPEAIRLYFTEGGRDLDDYDREVRNTEAICITFRSKVEY